MVTLPITCLFKYLCSYPLLQVFLKSNNLLPGDWKQVGSCTLWTVIDLKKLDKKSTVSYFPPVHISNLPFLPLRKPVMTNISCTMEQEQNCLHFCFLHCIPTKSVKHEEVRDMFRKKNKKIKKSRLCYFQMSKSTR